MKFQLLTEAYKNKDFILHNFKKAVYDYIPSKSAAEIMFNAKVKNISDEEFKQIENYVNSFHFPLTIYRGLKLSEGQTVDTSNPGVNWTIDKDIFKQSNSAFKNSTHMLQGVIQEKDVDWPETIQNYIYYSLRPHYGFYPELEVTINKNAHVSDLKIYKRTGVK